MSSQVREAGVEAIGGRADGMEGGGRDGGDGGGRRREAGVREAESIGVDI